MKLILLSVSQAYAALFLTSILSAPAWALDCMNASGWVDKLICTTPKLKEADKAMSAAYFKLLRETTDPEFHEALIRSQRRWLYQRGLGPQRYGAAEDDKTNDGDVLLKLTRDRMNALKKSILIEAMKAQRQAAAKDSGGPFAGYGASCSIFPPPYGNWTYSCLGAQHRQNGNRICSVSTEWASGHTTEYRLMSLIENGKVRAVASCSFGYADTVARCPGTGVNAQEEADAHWDMMATAANVLAERGDIAPPQPEKLWKYDPDIELSEDDPQWMRDCLSAPVFPPLDQRGARSPEQLKQ